MVVKILAQKYKTGCGRGMAMIEYPSLLAKLNMILEWDLCSFPLKPKENEDDPSIEDREFLGTEPELKPGDCFLVSDGQVVAVESPEQLVLIISETGPKALQRIWDETIAPEIEMFMGGNGIDIKDSIVDVADIPNDYDKTYRPVYYKYKIWRDKFLHGRVDDRGPSDRCVKVEMISDLFIRPIELYMLDWDIKYRASDIEDDEIEMVVSDVLSWFYNNYPRIQTIETKRNDSQAG